MNHRFGMAVWEAVKPSLVLLFLTSASETVLRSLVEPGMTGLPGEAGIQVGTELSKGCSWALQGANMASAILKPLAT